MTLFLSILSIPRSQLSTFYRSSRSGILSFDTTRSIGSITAGKKISRFDDGPGLPILGASRAAALKRKAYTLPPRTGLIGIKKGMTSVYDSDTGIRIPVTIIQVDRAQVVAHKTFEKHGYFAVQVGSGFKNHDKVTRPMLGHYATHGVSPKRHLVEFRVKDDSGLASIGTLLTPSWFLQGQYVDVRANCKGKGFAGGMKRHGFGGQPASHGTSLTHRALGSAGQSQGGGSRVYPGKRMPGNMGGQRVTVQNLRIVSVDEENGLIALNGSVPGPDKGIVMIQDAIKKPWPEVSAPGVEEVADALKS